MHANIIEIQSTTPILWYDYFNCYCGHVCRMGVLQAVLWGLCMLKMSINIQWGFQYRMMCMY